MSDTRDPERDQVAPVHNDGPSCHDLVIEDMRERKEHGLNKYKTILQPFNGRSFLQDAYEEVLDLAAYLRGKLEEERQRGSSWASITPELFNHHRLYWCNRNDHYLGECCRACGHNIIKVSQSQHYADIVNQVNVNAPAPHSEEWVSVRTEGNVEDPEVVDADALQTWTKTVYPFGLPNNEGRTFCVNHADRVAGFVVWPSGSDRGYPACRECFDMYEAHEAPIRTVHLFRRDNGNPICTNINGDPVEAFGMFYEWGPTDAIQPCQMCNNISHIWQTDLRDKTKAQCAHVATELKLIQESAGYVKGQYNREHWARICKQCDETIKRYDTL